MAVTLVVEDGSAVANANAYVDVSYCDSFHTNRGRDSWGAFTTEKKKACIVRATDYIEKRFGTKFRGNRLNKSQELSWPRGDAYDDSGFLFSDIDKIPRKLKQAVAEYALRAGLVGELAPDALPLVPPQDLTTATPTVNTEYAGGQIRRVAEVVDKLQETKSYQTPDQLTRASLNRLPSQSLVTEGNIPEYPAADLLIRELIRSSGNRRLARG